MRLLMAFLVCIFVASSAIAKSNRLEKVAVKPGPALFYSDLQPILRALDAGEVSVVDVDCNSPSYSESADLVIATISGQNYYVVLNNAVINGRTYGASYCEKLVLSNGSIEIECAAYEVPATVPSAPLSFSMIYSQTASNPPQYVIQQCPQTAP